MTVVEQRVDQRPCIDARRRVNHHAAPLVDDDDIRILIENVKRYILRFDGDFLHRRHRTDNLFPTAQLIVRLVHHTVHRDLTGRKEALCIAARDIRNIPHKKDIQTLPCKLRDECHAHERISFFTAGTPFSAQRVPKARQLSRRQWQYPQH